MVFEIKHQYANAVLFISSTAIDLASAVKEAVKLETNLCGANLEGANLCGAEHVYSFGPIGEEKRIGYAVTHASGVVVKLGCFWGAETDALVAIEAKYGAGSNYAAQVALACKIVKGA